MRRVNANKVGDLFRQLLKESGLEEGVERVDIFDAWNKVVDEKYTRFTVEKQFSEGKLICRISSSVAKNWLTMNRKIIVDKINAILGEERVKELIIR